MSSKHNHLPDRNPDPVIKKADLEFSASEKKKIKEYLKGYPENDGAAMRVLWLAQEKFGFLPPEVIKLCADEIDVPYAKVYGVATFYTQYYKQKKGDHVLDVCTCFSCQMVGGYDMLKHIEKKLKIKAGETTADGKFTLQEAECLGACGSGPMLQITNGPYVHHLTEDKVDHLLDDLKEDKVPPFTSVTLPQDDDEMGGNRRSDVKSAESSREAPRAAYIK